MGTQRGGHKRLGRGLQVVHGGLRGGGDGGEVRGRVRCNTRELVVRHGVGVSAPKAWVCTQTQLIVTPMNMQNTRLHVLCHIGLPIN